VSASLDDPDFVVETFHEAQGELVLGLAEGRDAIPVPIDHLGELLVRSERLPLQRGTPVLSKVAEKHFGQSLEWFFDQWIEDGGMPVLKWGHDVVQEGGAFVLKLEAKQEQKKYRLVVPIYIHFPGDKVAVRPWVIEGESATRSLKLPSKPDSVSLNDNLESLVILKNLRAL
jgi:hypothetical protein